MYFFIKNIEKTIILPPSALGPKIDNLIISKLISQVEGKCHPKYGWIIAVYNIVDYGEGLICENSDVIYKVKYNAVTFRPIN
jgi:DNA-directed RNA polymerase subunit E'/Rpb7